jgi:hypothetical protein
MLVNVIQFSACFYYTTLTQLGWGNIKGGGFKFIFALNEHYAHKGIQTDIF